MEIGFSSSTLLGGKRFAKHHQPPLDLDLTPPSLPFTLLLLLISLFPLPPSKVVTVIASPQQ
jgi:hypothetical protein